MPTKGPPALVCVGDLHAGSSMGLMPPQFTSKDGNTTLYNPKQRWLWECWLDFWEQAAHYQIDAVIVNGDAPNGVNARDAQSVVNDEGDQVKIAIATLAPLLQLRAERKFPIYATKGTGFHAGVAGAREELVWANVGAEPDALAQHTAWELWLNWRGRTVYATHHTSTARVYPLTPLVRALNESAVLAAETGMPLPDINIRSHVHQCNHAERGGRHIATLPAWQHPTEYTHKVASGAVPSVGGMIWWLDERGEIQPRKIIYRPPSPDLRVIPSQTAEAATLAADSSRSSRKPTAKATARRRSRSKRA